MNFTTNVNTVMMLVLPQLLAGEPTLAGPSVLGIVVPLG